MCLAIFGYSLYEQRINCSFFIVTWKRYVQFHTKGRWENNLDIGSYMTEHVYIFFKEIILKLISQT